MSAPGGNRLVYTAPPVNSLFNLPLEVFEGHDEVNMFLEVTDKATDERHSCSQGRKCRVRYAWDHTPIIHNMVPAIVYPGMTASVRVEPRKAKDYKRENALPIDLRIDGTSFNLDGYYDTEGNIGGGAQLVTGVVETDGRNEAAEVSAFFRGAGYAMHET
jgi:hypothetical protein